MRAVLGLVFPKARRLRERAEFTKAKDRGGRVHTRHFLFFVAVGPRPDAPSRLGITVTRKVGDAVRRNRVKRLVREAFRLDPALVPDGVDVLVIAKEGAPLLGLEEVQAEWRGARSQLQRRAREALTNASTVPKEGGP